MRRGKPAILTMLALLLAAAPLHFDCQLRAPALEEALAKDGNNGNGKGAGNNGNGNNGRALGQSRGQGNRAPDAVTDRKVNGDSLQIRYRNGYREQLTGGRYIMKDAKGRTIVNRPATAVDRVRLWLKGAGS